MTESDAHIVIFSAQERSLKRKKPNYVTIETIPPQTLAHGNLHPRDRAKQRHDNKPQLYKVAEAADRLGISRPTAYRLMKSGSLPAMRLTERGDMRISGAAIDQYIGNREREERTQGRRRP